MITYTLCPDCPDIGHTDPPHMHVDEDGALVSVRSLTVGTDRVSIPKGTIILFPENSCPACHGTGRLDGLAVPQPCPACHGQGVQL